MFCIVLTRCRKIYNTNEMEVISWVEPFLNEQESTIFRFDSKSIVKAKIKYDNGQTLNVKTTGKSIGVAAYKGVFDIYFQANDHQDRKYLIKIFQCLTFFFHLYPEHFRVSIEGVGIVNLVGDVTMILKR